MCGWSGVACIVSCIFMSATRQPQSHSGREEGGVVNVGRERDGMGWNGIEG